MWPPSSWPPGNRLSAVANIPTHAAAPWDEDKLAQRQCGTAMIRSNNSCHAVHQVKNQQEIPSCSSDGPMPAAMGCERHMATQRGTATTNPAIGPAIPMSNSAAREGDRALDTDERSERSDQAGKARRTAASHAPVIAAEEVVSHLVREQDEHQGDRKRKAQQQSRGVREPMQMGKKGIAFVAGCKYRL